MRQRIVPCIACVWEIGRYILLVNILHTYLNPLQSQEYQFFFFWLLSYASATLLGTALPAVRPVRFAGVARLVGATKILQGLAGLLFLLYELGVIPVLLSYLNSSAHMVIPATIFGGIMPLLLLITGIDLIAAVFLIKFTPERQVSRKERQAATPERQVPQQEQTAKHHKGAPQPEQVEVDITDVDTVDISDEEK